MKNVFYIVVAVATFASAHAAVVASTTESSSTGAFSTMSWASQLNATDLINSGTTTLQSATVSANNTSFGSAGINNGTSADLVVSGNTFFQIPSHFPGVATFNLNVSVNTLGYDITSIQSFMGWGTVSPVQANQTYTVEVSLVGSAAYNNIATVSFKPFTDAANATNYESHVILTENTSGILASGVDSIRFTFFDPLSPTTGVADGGATTAGTLIRELDVYGVATVPEPGSLMLSSLAVGLLLRRRRA